MTYTTEEWVNLFAKDLARDIAIHIKQYDLDEEDQKSLIRMIMISIRCWMGGR